MLHYPSPCEKIVRQQRRIVFWALFHILCMICLAAGMYYTYKFMYHPDQVIIQDRSGCLYRGKSGPVLCKEVAEDTARRAAVAFLDRSFEHNNQEKCQAIFGKYAQRALFALIDQTKDEFEEQSVRQFPEIQRITVTNAKEAGQCLVWVEGLLYRTGIYMDMPYFQKLEYVLGLRLAQSEELNKFPLRVLNMTYEERSIYDNKVQAKGGKK